MLVLKLIRKIGKILRGGAGRREIFLGALCGVLIGFNPVGGLSLLLMILLTLLLNANVPFALLGVLLGRTAAWMLAPLSFRTGYVLIHQIGLEPLFARLTDLPVLALMRLDVYALLGGVPYALVLGLLLGKLTSEAVMKIRAQMAKAAEKKPVGLLVSNPISRFLAWLAFGKKKADFAETLDKKSPLLRKSGIILVLGVALFATALQFLFLDPLLRHGIKRAISARTGAEVDLAKAHLSPGRGQLSLEGLRIVDPDHPERDALRIDALTADLSMRDLLRRRATIDRVSVSALRRDLPREKPGKIYRKPAPPKREPPAEEKTGSKPLSDYLAAAEKWKPYAQKAYDFLKTRRPESDKAPEEKPPAEATSTPKERALADAKTLGYLRAAANLTTRHPKWTIRLLEVDRLEPAPDYPVQTLRAKELSSNPNLNGRPLSLVMTPAGTTDPSLRIVLHFENPERPHELSVHLPDVPLSAIRTADAFPLELQAGTLDLNLDGTFTADRLDLPLSLLVRNLKAKSDENKSVMGMDAKTADEVFASLQRLQIDGALGGSILRPTVSVDYEKLSANLKSALVAAGKKELSRRADKELDKLGEKAGEQLDRYIGEGQGKAATKKAKGLLKKLF